MKFITLIIALLALSASALMADAWKSKKTTLNTKGGKVTFQCTGVATSAQCTLTGPANRWFGVGFGTKMLDTYAIIVDFNGEVSEKKLGDHNQGSNMNPALSLVTSEVVGKVRTVTFERGVDAGPDRFIFPAAPASWSMIAGVGPAGVLWADSTSMGGHSASGAKAPKFKIK